MPSDASLYHVPNPNRPSKKPPSAPLLASNLTFNSTLSALLATSATKDATARPSPRISKPQKDDIFTTHNKGTRKRALADISDGVTDQKHSSTSEAVDDATYSRSKRKMEEKARLYASMKRGDYVPRAGGRDKEAEGLVDFDRKWADAGEARDGEETSSDDYASEDDKPGDDGELVEFEDEFGRLREGTKREAAKVKRARDAAAYAEQELNGFNARPSRPDNVIVGDTVQSAAFNPDEPIAMKMEQLAQKRDRSLTPPEETHYDASKEIRSKGVGFYQFSRDNEERKEQMQSLDKEREETERLQREREARAEQKKQAIEARRKLIAEKRGKKLADRFLDELDIPIPPKKEDDSKDG